MSIDRPTVPHGNILIVDDTPANLRLLASILAEQGYRVRPVPSGPLALGAAQAEPPDLILLDIRMPDMDGYEVCRRLKANQQTRDIPVIFISALDATQDKVDAFTIGGVDYITKPFQAEEVLARVETHLTLWRLRLQLEQANRKMKQELELAGEVQASFLPRKLPDVPGWQFSAMLRPARETSGDFFDVNPLSNGRIGIVVGDVVDKGAGAALIMAMSWILMRTYAQDYPAEPARVLQAVNQRLLGETDRVQFVSIFYGILDPATGSMSYCNAGHSPPFLLSTSNSNQVHRLNTTGTTMGLFEDASWKQDSIQFAPGDVMALYTDGITEAQNMEQDFYGEGRLLESVRQQSSNSAPGIRDAILQNLDMFAGDVVQEDDIAVMVIKRELS